jgi:predicted small lipoprotein YifL
MQTVKTTLLLLICITLLGACGLKGPLYLPEEKPASGQSAPDKDTEEAKAKEKKNDTGKQPVNRQ